MNAVATKRGKWFPGRAISAYRPARRLPEGATYWAYIAGIQAAHRAEWMERAREAKNSGFPESTVTRRVQTARECNHGLIQSLRRAHANGSRP